LKSYEEIMEILEAFALTNSYRAAGELAGCSHHTVEHWVTMRDNGLLPDGVTPLGRVKLIDGFMPKIEEWVERSNGKVRGDVVFDKLVGVGYEGSDRTVRRALASVKLNWRAGQRRVYRPWVVEPGMWAQWDWGHGPKIAGRQTYLFCAWLAWCRFRVVLPVWDKTLPTVIACLDRSMRAFGGVPTYWLTDNERTVSTGHVAGIAVRHPLIVQVGHHYGVTVATCVPTFVLLHPRLASASPTRRSGPLLAFRVDTQRRAGLRTRLPGVAPISSHSGLAATRTYRAAPNDIKTAADDPRLSAHPRWRRISGDAEVGAQCAADDLAAVGVVGFGSGFDRGAEFRIESNWDDFGWRGAEQRTPAATTLQGFGVVIGDGDLVGEYVEVGFGQGLA
jgi:hypothetical protein